MDKNKEKIILCCIILLIVVMFVLITLLNGLNKQTEELGQDTGSSIYEDYSNSENNEIDRMTYFNINNCITNYLGAINQNNSLYYGYDQNGKYTRIVSTEDINQRIYDLLSEKYIKQNNITIENLRNHLKLMETDSIFVPTNIKIIQNGEIKSFLVQGLVENITNLNLIEEIFAIVNIDITNSVFSIEPIYGNYKNIEEIKIEQLEEIIKVNDNNIFYMSSSSNQDVAKDYINLYKRIALGKPEIMYNLLNKEYREVKFQNEEGFKRYIEENRQKILGIRVEKFQVNERDDYSEFICIDQYENYYIFMEKEILDYSVILDTYTIDLPEFIKQYNNASSQKRVGMNIEKIITAIKNGDYQYVYNKLDNTFRSNNFSTVDQLKNYIENNLKDFSNIEYLEFSEEGGLCIYKTKIDNKFLNVIMQLDSGTDFSMSFNVE